MKRAMITSLAIIAALYWSGFLLFTDAVLLTLIIVASYLLYTQCFQPLSSSATSSRDVRPPRGTPTT